MDARRAFGPDGDPLGRVAQLRTGSGIRSAPGGTACLDRMPTTAGTAGARDDELARTRNTTALPHP